MDVADSRDRVRARRPARARRGPPRCARRRTRGRSSEPGDSGAPSPAPAGSVTRTRGSSVTRPRPPASPALVGTIAFGTLFVLVAGGIGLAQVVRHVPLPGGSASSTTAPYRAWIGILAGVGGTLGALVAMRVRPASPGALGLPAIGLAALGLFSLGLLAGAVVARVGGRGALRGRGRRRVAPHPRERTRRDGRRPAAAGRAIRPSSHAACSTATGEPSRARSASLEDGDPRGAGADGARLPAHRPRAHIGLTGPPGLGQVEPDLGALPAPARRSA